MLPSGSFFADIVIPSASDGHLAHDLGHGRVGVAVLAQLHEPGVLREAAGVEEQRHAGRAQASRTARRFSIETGCPPPELFVSVMNTTGTSRSASTRRSASTSMLPLNGCREDGTSASGDRQVERLGAGELDVRARGVEVGVVRDRLAGRRRAR